jgi:hypothetical protein
LSSGRLSEKFEGCWRGADGCLCSLTCDYLGRKFAIITTTAMIVVGGILATGGFDGWGSRGGAGEWMLMSLGGIASNGPSINGMFWMMTVCT